jgi:hypothetical protein
MEPRWRVKDEKPETDDCRLSPKKKKISLAGPMETPKQVSLSKYVFIFFT